MAPGIATSGIYDHHNDMVLHCHRNQYKLGYSS